MSELQKSEALELPKGVSPNLLMEFLRAMVRDAGPDHVALALMAAAGKIGASKEEVDLLIAACAQEQKLTMWPKGFM